MKFDFDERFDFKEDIEIMNLQRQMESQQLNTKSGTFGFNGDELYRLTDEQNFNNLD